MNALIVDDDPLICDLLHHFCSKVDAINEITVANNGLETINLINQISFDVIFLDYHLPDLTGEDILNVTDKSTAVVMITSNKDFAHKSYDYDQIVDFLTKPLEFNRFLKSIKKVLKFRMKSKDQVSSGLFIKDGTKLVKVDLDDVLYIKAAANYVQLQFSEKKVMTLITLKELESKLPNNFQRIHRSTIVNVNKITSISSGELQIGNENLSISDSYQEQLLDKINLLG